MASIDDGIDIDGNMLINGNRYPFIMKNFYEKQCDNLSNDSCVVHWTSTQGHKVTLVCDKETKKIKTGMTIYFSDGKPIGILTMEYRSDIKNYHYILTRITDYKPSHHVEFIKYAIFNRKEIDKYVNPFKSFPPCGVKFTKGGAQIVVIEPLKVWS